MSRNNNPARVIIGLLIFVVFGFIFFMPITGFFTIFPSIFIIFLIVSIVATVSNIYSKTDNRAIKYENQVNTKNINPYRVENKSQEYIKTSQYQKVEEEIELKPIIRFCQFCGTKIERDAMFCHNCGSKLDHEL